MRRRDGNFFAARVKLTYRPLPRYFRSRRPHCPASIEGLELDIGFRFQRISSHIASRFSAKIKRGVYDVGGEGFKCCASSTRFKTNAGSMAGILARQRGIHRSGCSIESQ